jgi:hypothetical protein
VKVTIDLDTQLQVIELLITEGVSDSILSIRADERPAGVFLVTTPVESIV